MGGVDNSTGKETGLEVVRQVYPKLSMTPGILLAPRFSKDATVAAALQAKTKSINSVFGAVCVVDIDCSNTGATKYTAVKTTKEAQAVSDPNAYAVWPFAKVGNTVDSGSALAAALTAYTDAQNDDTPNVSPSNKTIAVSAACLEDGTEVVLDQEQANTVNSFGVATWLNMNGFRLWGNNTAAYPRHQRPERPLVQRPPLPDVGGQHVYPDLLPESGQPRQQAADRGHCGQRERARQRLCGSRRVRPL